MDRNMYQTGAKEEERGAPLAIKYQDTSSEEEEYEEIEYGEEVAELGEEQEKDILEFIGATQSLPSQQQQSSNLSNPTEDFFTNYSNIQQPPSQ